MPAPEICYYFGLVSNLLQKACPVPETQTIRHMIPSPINEISFPVSLPEVSFISPRFSLLPTDSGCNHSNIVGHFRSLGRRHICNDSRQLEFSTEVDVFSCGHGGWVGQLMATIDKVVHLLETVDTTDGELATITTDGIVVAFPMKNFHSKGCSARRSDTEDVLTLPDIVVTKDELVG